MEKILGIDTSNYTTSLAMIDINKNIIVDSRRALLVKQGERGLRQSHALFQHIENLSELLEELLSNIDQKQVKAVAVSNRPRPVEGSYMPVFKLGLNYARVMAATLGIPLFRFSHQEGHIEAIKYKSSFFEEDEFLAFHLSGGTCELLHIKNHSIQIIGGSKDISFGQLLDRVGVSLKMTFPAGKEMDMLAFRSKQSNIDIYTKCALLKKIPIDGLYINLSGIETQCQRLIGNNVNPEGLIYDIFIKISSCLCQLTENAIAATGCNRVLFTGGVAASQFIREKITDYFNQSSVILEFGDPVLASDNAVGIALLGGKILWA